MTGIEKKSDLGDDSGLSLAKAVLEWAAYDDQVAIEGWTGGIDEKWDNSRTRMVSMAREIVEKSKGEKDAGC